MSEKPTSPDLELVRQLVEAINRRDYDAALALFTPAAVVYGMRGAVFEGREAIRGLLTDWIGPYDDYDQELEEFSDLGAGVSLSVLHLRARLTDSSGFVELRFAAVAKSADGAVERVATYTDIDEARAAAERLAEKRG
jgi:ketosteroid isomerase-like protein